MIKIYSLVIPPYEKDKKPKNVKQLIMMNVQFIFGEPFFT